MVVLALAIQPDEVIVGTILATGALGEIVSVKALRITGRIGKSDHFPVDARCFTRIVQLFLVNLRELQPDDGRVGVLSQALFGQLYCTNGVFIESAHSLKLGNLFVDLHVRSRIDSNVPDYVAPVIFVARFEGGDDSVIRTEALPILSRKSDQKPRVRDTN